MAKDIIIRDAKGANVPVDLSVSLYKDAADAGNLRGFEGGVGLSDSQNNFSLVCQLQVMF